MAPGDETRPDNRPVSPLFGDDGRADETAVVRNPVPPPDRGGRRAPAEPPVGAGVPSYGQPQASHQQHHGGGGLFDQPTSRPADPGRPTILANQADGWEQNLQEIEVVRSNRTGLILLFVLALLVVALLALGLAARSVFGGGGDDNAIDSGNPADVTTTTLGTETTVPPPTSTTVPFDPATQLRVTVVEDPFVCDSGTREFALIGGADPNETIAFSSPQTEGLRSGTADANGELPIRWQCEPDQAGTTWELTATGETSGRTATFLFAGVTTPGGTDTSETTGSTVAEPTALTVEVIEDPFLCDGGVRVFAGLSGAAPDESIAFSSPQSPGLRAGTADAEGNLPIRWQCDPDQTGTVWELTATGETSGRTVTFSFTGG